ncbi:LPD5 domain-containing protein [Achromobacter xylosoxidans]|uniref:LPD5 domain-containing protein n=1 Tax=Alcaligenes xylosoxydans xylosoxydans TaxID=85698 RepID=UPI0006C59CD7|nr:LPD5 domain-containing protein [Achromobacter xylosoxidans]CUJ68357.1 Antirestriction protein [Achromobacter xylosoxidans]
MENFENPADGIEFKDNVAARRDQVRADLDVQFSDAGAPAGATGKPLPFTFRVADYTRPQQDGGGIEFVDFPKTLAGGAIKGAGSAVRGVGKVAEGLGRVGVTAVNQAFDAGLEIPTNPLEGAADATHRLGERVLDSRTEEAKRREADSQPGGDLDKPETWTLGRDPSASGLALQALNAGGSSALPVLASVAAGPLGVGARMAAGAAAGGAMGGGNAIEQARETIDGLDDQQLAAASSAYRDLIAQGVTPVEARARVRADAENAAFVRTLPVSAVGGAATGRILSPAGRVLGDRGVVAQTLGKAALAGTEEAVQEVGEGYATQKGINAGAGMALDPMAGSFGNAALGFVAGMGPGAVHGATEGVRHRGVPSAPSLQAGDVMHASGKPFVTASAARQRAEELGEGAQVLRYENGFIVRPGAAVDQQATGAALAPAEGDGGTEGAPAATDTANADGQAAGFAPRQQVYLRQNGRELPVEFLGVESNAATARPGGEQLARIRTADGRGRFVRLSELFAEPMPGNSLREAMGGTAALEGPEAFPVLDGPIQRAALPAPDGYAAGEGFVARDSWRMPANAPRGIRNNNPGNIQKGAGFQGEVEGNDPRFATFATPEDGIRAIGMNLLTYQRQHGLDTVQGILNRWAPPSENDTGAYVGQVARALGVEPNQQLDLSDPATLTGLTAAIIRHENAMQPYNAAQLEAAVSAALSGAPVRRALPAPVYQVDGEGVAATAGQRDAELARQAAMGMTPDVAAAGVRHPGAATDAAAHEAATSPTNDRPEPTDAQKDAGNYKVGRTRIAGMDISIENPEGSERRGTSPDGTSWANRMAGHYGYIRRTQGADGDQVDVFVRPGTTSDFAGPVFVIDQVDPAGGRFDESKVMLGYDTREDAERAYRDSYTPDWRGMGKITQMDVPTFKRWIDEGDTTKPASESGLGTLVAEPDITAKGGRPFLTRGAAQRAATLHGNADVEPADGGFVARPRTGQPPREAPAPSAADFARGARRDFLQMVRQAGGIRPELAADIYGDRAHLANRRAPGLFRQGGMDADRLVEAMQQAGYLPMEGDTVDLAGTAMDRVREALEGEAVYSLEQMDEAARRAYAEREAERFNNPKKTKAQIAADLFGAIEAMPPATTAAELGAQFDAAAYLHQQGITNGRTQEALIERAAIQAEESPAAFADALKSAAAAYGRRNDVDSGRGGQSELAGNAGDGAGSDRQGGPQGLTLESPTPDGHRAAASQQAAQQQQATIEAREADRRAAADAARGDFVLTGSDRAADQAAARGQQELAPAPQAPAAASEPPARPGGRIEDFGETLQGARKHYAEQYAERMRQAEALPIRDHALAETWPEPNYGKLLEDGADPFLVALVHASRDEIPSKPRKGWKLKGWADQVERLREFSGELLAGRIKGADVRAILDKSQDLRDVYGRAQLYEAVGHDRSLRGVSLRSADYSVFAGERFETPRRIWTVERKASTGMGNWPQIAAKGDSAAAAIADFKRELDKLAGEPAPAREVRFDIYSRPRMPGFYIGKKVGRTYIDLQHFDDVKAARAYLAENKELLTQRLDELKDVPAHRRETNAPRVGVDHRDGGDVTPAQFSDAFGFRGVQFGNYVEGGRRQADLNEAYDALMDLAGVIGVPARALSLNGELGLAFGARGAGGKDAPMAHYEPGQVVINLTKKRGAGSLAHEWWHGLDNYFSRRGGTPAGYASESGATTAGIRPAMAEAFGALKQTIGLIGMRERSRKLDERKAKDYWSTGRELSARAFESYVIAKLADQGAANDYLANVVPEKAFGDELAYPYPTAAEIPQIRAAFDRFFQTVEQVPGGDGRIALESRGDGGQGVDPAEARRLAADFMGKLPGAAALRVSVVERVDQIPEGAKPSAMAEGAYYPAGDGGRIYLVAENLPTAERLQQVLAHEVVGHFGVEALLGDRFRDVLADVRRLARAPDGVHIPRDAGPDHAHYATFEAVTARYPDYSAANRAREVLARMAEQGKRPVFLGRLYGMIRAALRRLGLNLQLNNADIRKMVVDAGRFLQRAPAARVSAGMQEAAASMAASRGADTAGAAVTVLTGEELGAAELGAKELRDAARAWAAENLKGKNFVNRATGWAVQVSQRGIKESLSRSARISKVQSMVALPGLIEQAILGHSEANRNKQRDPFTSQVHTLYAPVEIAGQDYLARLVVKENANGHLFYDHDLSDVVEAKRPDNTSAVSIPASKAGADRTPSGRAFTVEDIAAIVNREGRAGWVFDPGALESRRRHKEAPPAAGLRTSGPMESRAAAATAGAPPAQPGAAREPKRGAKVERPGETLSDIERRQRNKFLGKIGVWAEQEPIKARLAKASDRWQAKLVQGIFDQFAPLKGISATAYMQARLSKGADGAAEYLVRHGAVKLQDGALDTAGGKGLAEILAGLNGEHDHFMAWIAANRAERLAAEWQVRFDNGVTERFANEAAARAEAAKWPGAKAEPASRERLFTPDDIEVGKRLAQGKMADGRDRATVYREALGQFNELQRSVLDVAQEAGLVDPSSRKLWESEFYVPFYRVMEDDATGTMGPGQIGGLVGQHAYKRLKGGTDKLGDLVANTVSNWSHLLSASMKNLAAQGALQEAEKLGVATRVRQAERGSVRAMFAGQERHYQVSDPLVLNALTALHYVGSNDPFTKAARKFKHALTVGVTISPTFRVRNLLRDTIQAMAIDSNLSTNPLRNLVEGWKATGAESDTWRRLMAGGGAVRFGSFNDGNARNVKRLVDELGAHPDDVITSPAGMGRALRKAFDWYQETGDRSETINRAAIYQQARKSGRSHLEASYAARDLMDFTAGGTFSAVRMLSQVVPFFNARLQGMYKLGRGAAADPARFVAVTGAVAMASALLYLGMKDDDDYKQLPDWARNSFWITKLPGTDRFVYIPKPFEIGALGSVVERGTELAFGGDDFRLRDFGRTVGAILSEQLSMNPVPQLVKPAMEAAFNYDSFRERDIDSVGQQRLPAGDRFTASTSAGAVALGKALGLSPQRLEHLVRGYFGWLGTQALNVSDHLARPLSGLPENPRRDLSRLDNWFVVGDFVKESDPRSSKHIQRFYDEQREVNQVYAAFSQARELGDLERARELAGDDQMRLRALFKAADSQLRDVNLKIKALERASIPADEKRAQLDLLYRARNRLAALADQHARSARP